MLITVKCIADNVKASFLDEGQFIAKTMDPDDIERLDRPSYNQVMADITTSFTILIGIFFPSVTGNYSFERSSACHYLFR